VYLFNRLIIMGLILVVPFYSYSSDDSLFFEEDGRVWLYAGNTKVGEKTYVPENQDPENWDEAIIIHHIGANNIPLEVYYETFMGILNERSGNIFHSKILENQDDHLIFEWWIDPEEQGAQHGWIKVSKTPVGLQFFRYTTKNVDTADSIREIWSSILKDNNFLVVPDKISVDVDFALDGRDWGLAESSKTNQEFILKDQSLDEWTEKFSVDVFSSEGESPYAFYYKTIHDLEAKTGKNIETKVLDSNSKQIIFEWKVDDGEDSQWSYYKMTVLDMNLASGMHYISKDQESDERVKDVWGEIMKKARAKISYDYILEDENQETIGPKSYK
jgi:hypothetical protein